MRKKIRTYSGTTSQAVSPREMENRAIARQAAAEGMVLLKNEGVFPLQPGQTVALFGGGSVRTVKGGTGSGDVNEREVVSIFQGLEEAGIRFSNRRWLENFGATYQKAREAWRDQILEEMSKTDSRGQIKVYHSHIFQMPIGEAMKASDFSGARLGIYVISRTAGEDADRFLKPGDYYLTQEEKDQLWEMSRNVRDMAVVINTGGQIDLTDVEAIPNLKALMVISQPGMEGGRAFADLVTGAVTPSGKLADTWAKRYEDIPNAMDFSYLNGDTLHERYTEGQYVGYRYFDSFQQEAAYPFGYGLSYTTFDLRLDGVTVQGNTMTAAVCVTNTGETYAGREVVQLYASCPQTRLPKVHRKLVGFAKTRTLAPGQSQQLKIPVDAREFSCYDEAQSAWVVEQGSYGLWLGNSSRDLTLAAVAQVEQTVILEQVSPICPIQEELEEMVCPEALRLAQQRAWQAEAAERGLRPILFAPEPVRVPEIRPNPLAAKARALTEQLSDEQLIAMTVGAIGMGQGNSLGTAGIRVPGTAGETSSILEAEYGIPGVPMADGPAGLRLIKSYQVDQVTGRTIHQGMLAGLEGGIFADNRDRENARRYYQYTTAIPVGTLLAQTWDVPLLETVGRAVARELEEFGVGWWLAPGMNIHRNPLCGRNFEYYSEDPLISGKMAAAITRGVQSVPGVGTTVKHFACNNQEDNRRGSDTIIRERTLREIYLRGFEIAVRESQPMAIMTSYNLINGIHAANSRDLCHVAARREWGFQGIIMTDWTTTMPHGGSVSWRCLEAGNDLIMPGWAGDVENIRNALDNGSLNRQDLKDCVTRLLTVIFQTLVFEDPVPYGEQFSLKNTAQRIS